MGKSLGKRFTMGMWYCAAPLRVTAQRGGGFAGHAPIHCIWITQGGKRTCAVQRGPLEGMWCEAVRVRLWPSRAQHAGLCPPLPPTNMHTLCAFRRATWVAALSGKSRLHAHVQPPPASLVKHRQPIWSLGLHPHSPLTRLTAPLCLISHASPSTARSAHAPAAWPQRSRPCGPHSHALCAMSVPTCCTLTIGSPGHILRCC